MPSSPRIRILALLSLTVVLYFFANFQRTVVPGALFSELQQDLDVSAKAITGFGAAFMYVYAATQLAVGLLVDKYGGMRVLATGSILMAIGAMKALIDMDIFRPVCGFDGIILMGYVGKQMNTVKQDFVKISEEALDELSRLMQGETGREVVLPHTLVRMKYEDIIK